VLLIIIVFLFLVRIEWMQWTDPVIDFGAEIYVPWQLHQGAVLYRDLASFKGPFSPYLNLLWFTFFGVSLRTLVIANLGILIACTTGLTLFVRRCTDRLTATVAAILFLAECGLGNLIGFNMNFVTPFVHELTHGLTLSIFLLLLLVRLQKHATYIAAWGAGLLLGCILLTRIEVGIAALGMTALALMILWYRTPKTGIGKVRIVLSVIVGTALPPCIAWGLLSTQMPAGQALSGMLGTWKDLFTTPVASTYFFLQNSGMDQPVHSLIRTVLSFLFVVDWIVILILIERLTKKTLTTPAWMITVGFILACMIGIAISPFPPLLAGRPFPIIVTLVLLYSAKQLWNYRENEEERIRWTSWTLFAVFADLFLIKIFLNSRVYHYGFAHAAWALVLTVMTILWLIPQMLQAHGYKGLLFRKIAVIVLLLDALFIVYGSQMNHLRPHAWVGQGADAMIVFNDTFNPKARILQDLLEVIHNDVPANATLAPVPEGLFINYLSQHKNTVPYLNLMYTEMSIFGEPQILASFEKHPPDYIVLTQRDTSDFGVPRFGTSPVYGKSILDWIHAHYQSVWSEGGDPITSKTFAAELLVQKKGANE
jgi:hypothetical protein